MGCMGECAPCRHAPHPSPPCTSLRLPTPPPLVACSTYLRPPRPSLPHLHLTAPAYPPPCRVQHLVVQLGLLVMGLFLVMWTLDDEVWAKVKEDQASSKQ